MKMQSPKNIPCLALQTAQTLLPAPRGLYTPLGPRPTASAAPPSLPESPHYSACFAPRSNVPAEQQDGGDDSGTLILRWASLRHHCISAHKMDLSHLLNASGAAPVGANSQLPLPELPQYADTETRTETAFAPRGSTRSPMRRPRWPPIANGWGIAPRGGSGEQSFVGHEYKVDHTGTQAMGRAQHNFTHANFTPMIPDGPPNFSRPDIFLIDAQNLSAGRNYPLTTASTPFPHHPPLSTYDAADIVTPRRAAMKRTASLPPGPDRRRKRVPMRSIGAPVMRAGVAYTPSPENDVEDTLTRQTVLPPQNPTQPFAPTHYTHLNGNGAPAGNGSGNGRAGSIGDTKGTLNGFANGYANVVTNGPPHGNVNEYRKRDSNGIGNTVVIDLTDEPSEPSPTTARPSNSQPRNSSLKSDDVVIVEPSKPSRGQSRGTSDVKTKAMRKPRPSKSGTPISPAARWEAKMAARKSSSGLSSKAGSSKTGPSSKSGPTIKTGSSNGSGASTAVPVRRITPAAPLLPNGPAPAVVKKKRVRKKKLPPPPDPDVPYPSFSENFGNIPKEAVGDVLQIYDFCISFSKVLRLSPFSFRSLELALSAQESNPLIDNIVVRLVRTMLEDKAVSAELNVSGATAGILKTGKSGIAAENTFSELPYLLSIDDNDDGESFVDEKLRKVVQKMRAAATTWAMYEVLSLTERLRVLCELIDRTASTEEIRACVIHSIEFEDEERRKTREDLFALRRQAESDLIETRDQLLAFREKHGLPPSAIAAAAEAKAKEEAEKAAAAAKKNSKSKKKSKSKSVAGRAPKMATRKELIVAAQKERAEAAKKKAIEREEENFLQKIENLKAKITSIKARTAKPGTKKKEAVDGEEISRDESAARAAAAKAKAEAEVHLDRAVRNQDDPVRMHALGEDREYRRYWYVVGGGRLWVENTASRSWMHADEVDLIDRLLEWCSPHREPERALKTVLQKRRLEIEDGMKTLAKMKEKENAARDRKANTSRTRLGKRKSRNSLNSGRKSASDVADVPYLAYRNTLA